MGCCSMKCGMITLGVIGAVLIIIGGISVTVFDIVFDNIVIQEGTIAEGTIAYDAWSVVTTPTYMSYWFYNVTNSKEFLAQTKGNYVAPRMEEVGPYVFQEFYVKDNIEFLTEKNPEEVFFRQTVTLIFDRERSNGRLLTDPITTVNIIAASIAPIVEFLFDQFEALPDRLLPVVLEQVNGLYNNSGTELLFTKPAGDLLFGFEDQLYSDVVAIIESLAPGLDLPDRFGLFSTSNNSAGWFNYTVYTGKDHPELINVITSYDNKTELDYWGSKECNMINGTDGTTTPPFMKKEDKVYFFVDDVCRSLYGTYVEEMKVKGIPAWKYVIPPEIFEAPTKNEENVCFCPSPNYPLCNYSGVILIQACQAGAPVAVSAPHFHNGDGYFLSLLEGVRDPIDEYDETALIYEPNTGQAIKVDKRLQINFELKNNPRIDVLNQIAETIIFPVVWLNESALIGDGDADLLYGLLVVPAEAVFIIQIVFCVIGSIMFLTPFVYYGLKSVGSKKSKSKMEMKHSSSSSSDTGSQGSYRKAKDNKGYKSSRTSEKL